MGPPRRSIAFPLLVLLLVIGLPRLRGQEQEASCPAPDAVAHPNVLLDISGGYLNAGLAQERTEAAPIRQSNQGTLITGTYVSTFRTGTELVPDDSRWVFDVVLHGTGKGCAVAGRERVQLKGTFSTPFHACKRIFFDRDGMTALPAAAQSGTCITLHDVEAFLHGPVRERVGERLVGHYFERRKSEYEGNIARIVQSRLEEGTERAAAPRIDQANRNYRDRLRLPLERQGLFPSELSFHTTPTHLLARALLTGTSPPPGGLPPELAEGYDVGLRMHESFANNAARFFADKKVTNKELDTQLEWLAGPVRRPPPVVREWSMTYAHERPMQVTFADHRIKVVMRVRELVADGTPYPGLHIIVSYRLEPTAEGIKAFRVGGVEVVPPPGQTFGARAKVVAAFVKQRLEQIYAPVLVAKRPRAPAQLGQAGPMRPLQADANAGWLILAWERKENRP